MKYAWNPESAQSYADMKRRREIAKSLTGSIGNPKNVGEGLNAIGTALMARAQARKADKIRDQLAAGPNVSPELLQSLYGLPAYRRGTSYHPGGLAIVGEDGPEIVNLPQGAAVQPNPMTLPPGAVPEVGFQRAGGPTQMMDDQAVMVAQANGGVMNGDDPFQGINQQFSPRGDGVLTRNIAERELAQREAMNNLQLIMDELNASPELLDEAHTFRGQARNSWLRFRDKLGIDAFDISPEEEQRLGDVAAYRQKLLTNVNNYIKEITGAQVGQGDETRRLMAVQANEDDSPAEIIAKLQGALDMARLNVARFKYMQTEDISEAPTDKEMRDFLSQRGKAYFDEAVAAGMDPTAARMQAANRLSEEYGL